MKFSLASISAIAASTLVLAMPATSTQAANYYNCANATVVTLLAKNALPPIIPLPNILW